MANPDEGVMQRTAMLEWIFEVTSILPDPEITIYEHDGFIDLEESFPGPG